MEDDIRGVAQAVPQPFTHIGSAFHLHCDRKRGASETRENELTPMDMSDHERKVLKYYEENTRLFYLRLWDDTHLHFGYFMPDEYELPLPELRKRKPAATLRYLEEVIRPAEITREDLVADVGCGIGGTTLHVAKHHGSRIIGLNICESQNDVARSRAEEAGLSERVEFMYANCSETLPLPSGSVDVIINIETASHYSDRRTFLTECARVLKPYGRMVAADVMAVDGISREDYATYVQPVCDAWFLLSVETPSSYIRKHRDVGLEVLDFVDISAPCMPSIRLMEAYTNHLVFSNLFRQLSDLERQWVNQCRTFSQPMMDGYLRMQRYYARKAG